MGKRLGDLGPARLKELQPSKKILAIRFSEKDLAELKRRAGIYAGGNVSAWIRYSALTHEPKREELADGEENQRA